MSERERKLTRARCDRAAANDDELVRSTSKWRMIDGGGCEE